VYHTFPENATPNFSFFPTGFRGMLPPSREMGGEVGEERGGFSHLWGPEVTPAHFNPPRGWSVGCEMESAQPTLLYLA